MYAQVGSCRGGVPFKFQSLYYWMPVVAVDGQSETLALLASYQA
jgi:hypothetical protein